MLTDFIKAYDSLSHKYIDECLKMLNFGPSIRKWVSLFFCNIPKMKCHTNLAAVQGLLQLLRGPVPWKPLRPPNNC